VTLAATSFSLIVPSIEVGNEPWPGWGVLACVVGIVLGGIFLDGADKWPSHEHFVMGHEGLSSSLRRAWLFILAITLHNFPEGLAVGVGYGGSNVHTGT
jgi:ZIP family zinc transporter